MIASTVKRRIGNAGFRINAMLGRFQLPPRGAEDLKPLTILMYHGLDTDPTRLAVNGDLDIHPTACLREIQFLSRQGYQLAPADRPHDGAARGYLVISFDDCHRNTLPHLKRWLSEYRIPVLLAVCPDVIERGEVYWCEEVLARFDLMQQDRIRIDVDGREEEYNRAGSRLAVRRCCELPRQKAVAFFEQLRDQTSDVGWDDIRRSPYVHENMTWDEIRELSSTGCCAIAAHSLRHEVASQLSIEEFSKDATACKRALEAKLDVACNDYVYPFGSPGDFSDQTSTVLQRCGYSRTYTTVHKINKSGHTIDLGRFRGTGYSGSLAYYGRMWRTRHAEFLASAVDGPLSAASTVE